MMDDQRRFRAISNAVLERHIVDMVERRIVAWPYERIAAAFEHLDVKACHCGPMRVTR